MNVIFSRRKLCASEDNYRGSRGFVMCVSDYETDSEEEAGVISGRKFACHELYMRSGKFEPLYTKCGFELVEITINCHMSSDCG